MKGKGTHGIKPQHWKQKKINIYLRHGVFNVVVTLGFILFPLNKCDSVK